MEAGTTRAWGTFAAAIVLPAAALLLAAGCASPESKPKDLTALRRHLLEKAEQKYKHALRITERRSPDPFNQAREQLVFTMIELGKYDEAESTGRRFVEQQGEYLAMARSKLAEVELDWQKALAAEPKIKDTRREDTFREVQQTWQARIRGAERQAIGLSLLIGEVLTRSGKHREAIAVFKDILDIQPDHNTALRRLAQACIHEEEHGLAASYLERAFAGIMERLRDLQESAGEAESGEGTPAGDGSGEGAGPLEGEGIPEVAPKPSPAREQIRALEAACIQIGAVIGALKFLTGEYPRSDDWFARAFEIDPTCIYLDLKTALALIREGKTAEAGRSMARFRESIARERSGVMLTLVERIEARHLKR